MSSDRISVETLHKLLICDAEAGKLWWRERGPEWFRDSTHHRAKTYRKGWNSKNAGREALTINQSGYRAGRILGQKFSAHRVIWAMHYGQWPKHEIDHIDGDTSNNRIGNLRDITHADNTRNARRRRDNSSGFMGVGSVRSGRWRARITFGGKPIILGTFDTREEAHAARMAAVAKYGFSPNHGRRA